MALAAADAYAAGPVTMGERVERLWPSLVALVGTVAVVVALLWAFGGEISDSTPPGGAAAEEPGPDPTAEASPDPQISPGAPPSGSVSSPDPDPTETAPGSTDGPVIAAPDVREPVGIANQTSVAGLAQFARERLEAGGWEVPAVSTFHGTVPETTVYYPDGMREAAEALAAQFPEIGRIQPTFPGLNPTRLVVVLVDDYVAEVGSP